MQAEPAGAAGAARGSLAARLWRRVRRLGRRPPDPPAVTFGPEQIETLRRIYYDSGAAPGGPWDPWRDAHMRLPEGFVHGLDPWSDAYRQQQMRVWRLVTGLEADYDPDLHEREEPWVDVDPVRRPGYYTRRDPAALTTAGDHWLATGMLLKHCGLRAGDHALEYGPGFGQSALALARLGVEVDTVDISATFCDFVQRQSEFFGVPLRAHRGRFGDQPQPGRRYRLIWFYESFHHCWDFQQVVPRLVSVLSDDGRVILGGEPIVERECAAVPYPWGVRLHSEVAAVMRQNAWMELGFTEPFLFELFERSGLAGRRIDSDASPFGTLYVFEHGVRP